MKAQTQIEIKERPILFSGPTVRAILDGRKTQTRRVMKPQPTEYMTSVWEDGSVWFGQYIGDTDPVRIACPYGKPGDRLWVRETWYDDFGVDRSEIELQLREGVYYRADGEAYDQFEDHADLKWRPSIFMPRWASRITLEITSVRVEKLQDISEENAKAEGVEAWSNSGNLPSWKFQSLWDRINGKKHPWGSNPFVWVIQFTTLS